VTFSIPGAVAGGHDAHMRVAPIIGLLGPRTTARVADLAVEIASSHPAALAATLQRVLGAFEQADMPMARQLEQFERARAALLSALEPILRALRFAPVPFSRDNLLAFDAAARTLRAASGWCRAASVVLRDDDAPESMSPTAARALSRALDFQSRLLIGACHARVALERSEWDGLCLLAHHAQRAGLLDESFPDAEGAPVPCARSAFAVPVLLRLLEPLGLARAEFELAASLARSGARRVGVVIDVDGEPHANPRGPAILLSAQHGVRLDTRRLVLAIEDCARRLGDGAAPAEVGLRTRLPRDVLPALLERVRGVWCADYRPAALVRPPIAHALLHIGLPRQHGQLGSGPGTSPGATQAGTTQAGTMQTAGAAARNEAAYVFGRNRDLPGVWQTGAAVPAIVEHDPAAPHDADFARRHAQLRGDAESVTWRGHDARRTVFTRAACEPALRLGQLVAVLPVRPQPGGRGPSTRPGSGPSRLMVGRVVTLAQTGTPESRRPFGHDVGVAFWPGSPLPVGVRLDGDAFFEDAWWFASPSPGEPQSLVLRRERFERVGAAVLRDVGVDREVRLAGLIERGVDYDRVAVEPR
jgi:hypothetical protein